MKRELFGQLHKLHFVVEREDTLFWWKPWIHAHRAENAFWQDYCNYIWHVDAGWLWWSMEITWQKTRWGWKQTSRVQDNPFFRVWFE